MSIPATSSVTFTGLEQAETQVSEIVQAIFEATQAVAAIVPATIQSQVDPDNAVTCGFRDNLLSCLQVDYIKAPIEQALGELRLALNAALEAFGAPQLP